MAQQLFHAGPVLGVVGPKVPPRQLEAVLAPLVITTHVLGRQIDIRR